MSATEENLLLSNLPLAQWKVTPKQRPWQWVNVTLPFVEARKMFQARTYDFVKNVGEQRPVIDAWVSKLRKIMEADEFTPASWSGCLRPAQRDKVIFNDDGTVTIPLGKNPIALIDGNHRGQALLKYYEIAERKEDQETMDLINNCSITIQIYLDPDRARQAFQGLQEGKKVSPDLLALQKMQGKNVSSNQKMAYRVAMALNGNNNSHLYGRIGTGTAVTNMLGIKTATTKSSSELACSILGGANIALAFDKDQDWLERCYIEAWEIVQSRTTQVEDPFSGKPKAGVLLPGQVLCPLGQPGGKKGGLTLITGIGNMWAYMKGVKVLEDVPVGEANYLAAVVDQVFDMTNEGGLAAPQKRTLMGEFAREYFRPIIEAKLVAAASGIPHQLRNELMSPGTFGSKKEQSEASIQGEQNEEEEIEVETETNPDDDWLPPPSAKKKSRKDKKSVATL